MAFIILWGEQIKSHLVGQVQQQCNEAALGEPANAPIMVTVILLSVDIANLDLILGGREGGRVSIQHTAHSTQHTAHNTTPSTQHPAQKAHNTQPTNLPLAFPRRLIR